MAKILITGARLWYAYNSLNMLYRDGHELYIAGSSKLSMALYSKYVKKSFIYPDISEKSEEFIEKILEIVEEYHIDYLLPVYEETFVLSYYKDKLKGKVGNLLSDFEIVWKLHDKYSLYKIAKKLDIPTPLTYKIDDYETSKLIFPVVLKPRRLRGAMGIKVIKNIEELDHYKVHHDLEDYIVQEYVSQEQYCTIGLAKNGELVSNTIYHNLEEYPYKGGFGIVRESLDIEIINDYIKKLVKEMHYSGWICADFLKDPSTGIFKMTEINPRMSPGLMVAYSEGINLPGIYLDLIEDKNIDKNVAFSKGGRGTYTTVLRIGWLLEVIFSGNFKMLRGFFRKRKHKIEDVWNWKDPIPFFVFFAFLLLSLLVNIKSTDAQQTYYYRGAIFNYKKFLKGAEV